MVRIFFALLSITAAGVTYYLLLDGYGGLFAGFMNNYAMETSVVAAAYFLSVSHRRISGNKIAKAAVIFILASAIEVAQFFDVNIFGSDADPVDFFFFAIGLGVALFIDYQIIPRLDGTYEKVEFK